MIIPQKKQNFLCERKLEVESELGRIDIQVFDKLAQSQQPKERIDSVAYKLLASKMCTNLSYRKSVEMINLFLHREDEDTIKLRTLSDSMNRIGNKISCKLEETSGRILKMNGFNKETGLPEKNIILSENITTPNAPAKGSTDEKHIQNVINDINDGREEEIPFNANELEIEANPADCVYISIDDIGVKHQKASRNQEETKDSKYIENTVVHIQYGSASYALTSVGMRETIKLLLSFLLFNNLLNKELIFFTDGAKNIKSHIESIFSFHPYTVILDWFHLKKKCQELLSMSIKGKESRNEVLEKLLRILWAGDVDGAVKYLRNLPSAKIKNEKWLEEQTGYLERKKEMIKCYAVRAKLELRNSSNPVEKENDILVAQRQKHNGMSWSKNGSGSLAAIKMVFQNGYEDIWFRQEQISFTISGSKPLDLCA